MPFIFVCFVQIREEIIDEIEKKVKEMLEEYLLGK